MIRSMYIKIKKENGSNLIGGDSDLQSVCTLQVPMRMDLGSEGTCNPLPLKWRTAFADSTYSVVRMYVCMYVPISMLSN